MEAMKLLLSIFRRLGSLHRRLSFSIQPQPQMFHPGLALWDTRLCRTSSTSSLDIIPDTYIIYESYIARRGVFNTSHLYVLPRSFVLAASVLSPESCYTACKAMGNHNVNHEPSKHSFPHSDRPIPSLGLDEDNILLCMHVSSKKRIHRDGRMFSLSLPKFRSC